MAEIGDNTGFTGGLDPAGRRANLEVLRQLKQVKLVTTGDGTIRLADTNDVTLTSTNHPFQIGEYGAANLAMDGNEIMARNNGAAATLNLNLNGGTVQIGTGVLNLGSVIGDRISVYGNGEYALGIGGGTLYYNSAGLHDFRVGSTLRHRFDSYRHAIYGASSGEFQIGDWASNGGYTALRKPGTGAYMLFGNTGADNSLHIRADSGVVYIGSGGTDAVNVQSNGIHGTHHGTSNGTHNGNQIGYVEASFGITTNVCSDSAHTSQNWQIRSYYGGGASGKVAGLSMWPVNWGVAPVLRCFSDYGEMIECGNNPGTGYASFGALSYVTRSSIKLKKNVKERTKEEKDAAKERFKQAKSKVWDDLDPEMTVQLTDRFKELDAAWQAKGNAPLKPKEEGRDFYSAPHDCTKDDDCGGTAESPCGLVRRHQERRGFVAEELVEWMPEAVMLDKNNEVMGIDYSVVTTELVDIVQDLMAEIDDLKARVVALEAKSK